MSNSFQIHLPYIIANLVINQLSNHTSAINSIKSTIFVGEVTIFPRVCCLNHRCSDSLVPGVRHLGGIFGQPMLVAQVAIAHAERLVIGPWGLVFFTFFLQAISIYNWDKHG